MELKMVVTWSKRIPIIINSFKCIVIEGLFKNGLKSDVAIMLGGDKP